MGLGALSLLFAITCLSRLRGEEVEGDLHVLGIQSSLLTWFWTSTESYELVISAIAAVPFALLLIRHLSMLDQPRNRFMIIAGMGALMVIALSTVSLRSPEGEQISGLLAMPKTLLLLFLIPAFSNPIEGVSTLKRYATAIGFVTGSVALVMLLYYLVGNVWSGTGSSTIWVLTIGLFYAAWAGGSYELWRAFATAKASISAAAVASYILLALAIVAVVVLL